MPTVFSFSRVSTISNILIARTAEENHCQSALHCTEALEKQYTEEVAASKRMQDNRASRLRPNILQEVDGNLKAMSLGHIFSLTMILTLF